MAVAAAATPTTRDVLTPYTIWVSTLRPSSSVPNRNLVDGGSRSDREIWFGPESTSRDGPKSPAKSRTQAKAVPSCRIRLLLKAFSRRESELARMLDPRVHQ